MRAETLRAGVVAALLLAVVPGAALAQSSRNVLVVVNAASADSVRIGEYYVQKRQVPEEQLLRLNSLPADPPDGIDRQTFDNEIAGPVAGWLARNQAHDRILFIVLTKGIPLRINAGTARASAASVDSELSLLYRRMTGQNVPLPGPFPNPYFLGDREITQASSFRRETSDLYLVTRLDGYTADDVLKLIDRGIAPSDDGRFVLDGKVSVKPVGNNWLSRAADRLKAAGLPADRVVLDLTATVLVDQVDVLGYYSWGSNDPAITRREFGLTFRPGAIGGMFVSTDGRTFREPPAGWTLPGWSKKEAWFMGSPQSLAGDLIRAGITGVAGHVSEPLLGNTIRPDILFPAYRAGFSLAEAYYLAMPSLSWMTVVVGDPLCKPFGPAFAPLDDPPIDPKTELPTLFSARRLERMDPSMTRDVQQLALLVESRTARGVEDGAVKEALERLSAAAPQLAGPHLQLGVIHERLGDHDRAIEQYRATLESAPDSVVALNNLAYSLAVHRGDLAGALPLAERARTLAPRAGVVADTLGWIYFISGDVEKAKTLLIEAARLSPQIGEVRLHLAQVHAAAGDRDAARAEAAKAVELDPSLEQRPELRALKGPQ